MIVLLHVSEPFFLSLCTIASWEAGDIVLRRRRPRKQTKTKAEGDNVEDTDFIDKVRKINADISDTGKPETNLKVEEDIGNSAGSFDLDLNNITNSPGSRVTNTDTLGGLLDDHSEGILEVDCFHGDGDDVLNDLDLSDDEMTLTKDAVTLNDKGVSLTKGSVCAGSWRSEGRQEVEKGWRSIFDERLVELHSDTDDEGIAFQQ